jgi:hypothetical protein
MLVPALIIGVLQSISTVTFPASWFLLLVTVLFGLISWTCIEALRLDRITFLFVAFVIPWLVSYAILLVILLLNRDKQIPSGVVADAFGYLTEWTSADVFGYGALFFIAGVGAVALSKLLSTEIAE